MIITGFKTIQKDKYTDNNNDQEYNKNMDLLTKNGRTDLENKITILNKKKPIISEQLAAAREMAVWKKMKNCICHWMK